MKQLSYVESYKAMFFFLRGYFKKTRHGDVACLLSDIMFEEDENEIEIGTADPASWSDWLDSIYKTFPKLNQSKIGELTYFQAFQAMYTFVYEYEKRTKYEDLPDILNELEPVVLGNETSSHDPIIWKRWLESIQRGIRAKSSAD